MKIFDFFDNIDYSVSNWGKIWNSYGLEILVLLNLLLFFIYWMCNLGKPKQGSMTNPQHLIIPSSEKVNYSKSYSKNYSKNYSKSHSKSYSKSYSHMSKGEAECKRCLEKIFGMPFEKIRPNFLRNPVTNKNLELDLYNSQLKIACEYNGEQHYVQSEMFSKESLNSIKYRDQMKLNMCEKNGIFLIVVPYTVKLNQIETFIIKHVLHWRKIKYGY